MPTGDFYSHQHPCPNCGHCSTCGRSNWHFAPYHPAYPWWGVTWPPTHMYIPGAIVYTTTTGIGSAGTLWPNQQGSIEVSFNGQKAD